MDKTSTNKRLSNRSKVNILLFVQMFWIVIVGAYVYVLLNEQNISEIRFRLLIYISFLFLIWQIISWNIIENRIFSPYITYSVFLYVFHFGQVLLWAINMYSYEYRFVIFDRVQYDELVNATIFSFCSIVLFHTGALVFASREFGIKIRLFKSGRYDRKDKIENPKALIALKYAGIVLCVFSILPMLIVDFSTFLIAMKSGYIATYDANITQGVLDNIAHWFRSGVIFLLVSIKNKRRLFNSIFYSMIIYSIIKMIIIGRRGYEILFIIALIWLRHNLVEPIQGKKVFKYGVLSYIGLTIMAMVGENRRIARIDTNLFEALGQVVTNNVLIRQIMEFGGTLYSVVLVMRYTPNTIPFVNGFTYIAGFLKLLPLARSKIREIEIIASSGEMINRFVTGIGDSIIAEFYYNFAWKGMLLAILFGGIIAIFSLKSNKAIKENNYPKIACYTIFLYQILWTVRSSTVSIIYNAVVYIGFPYFLYWLIFKFSKSK